jgi:hypothetical protein
MKETRIQWMKSQGGTGYVVPRIFNLVTTYNKSGKAFAPVTLSLRYLTPLSIVDGVAWPDEQSGSSNEKSP